MISTFQNMFKTISNLTYY